MNQPDPQPYDPAADPVHGTRTGMNNAARWGGWTWSEPRGGAFFRTCSFCGSIHPEDLAPHLVPQGECLVCGETGWSACFSHQRPEMSPAETARVLADPNVSDANKDELRAMNARHTYDPGGAYLQWADRKYGWPHKTYVENLKSREPDRLHIIGARNSTPDDHAQDGESSLRWVPVNEIPEGTVTDGWRNIEEHYDTVGIGKRPTLHAKFYSVHLADPAISQDAKDAIHRASGLRFTWTDDGRVGWEQW